MATKIAVILQAGPGNHEGLARALHSLLYSKELLEKGAEVRLVFDGAGTQWPARWHVSEEPTDKRMAGLFETMKQAGMAYLVCDFCSGAFGAKEELQRHSEPLAAEYMDHPSIASLVDEGFQVLIL